jgi:hypothetical protein
MKLTRVIVFAALAMSVASMAYAQAQLQGGVLKMPVDNASTPLGNPLAFVDTTNNAVVINTVQISASPYSTWTDVSTIGGTAYGTLNYYVQTAYNNAWAKAGLNGAITSYGLAGDDTAYNNLDGNGDTAIGLMTVDDYENTIGWGNTFFGANLASSPATGVLLRYTYLGDTDFDGAITAADVGTVLIAYGAGLPSTWINGSTDYGQGGVIQAYDVGTILVEYGLSLPAFNPPASAGGITPVPEPSTIVLLLVGVSLLVLRRRLSK